MIWIRAALPLTLVVISGCGSEEDRIPLLPVSGIVTSNGKPLANASIVFLPEPKNEVSTPGNDVSGPDGTFKLMWRSRAGVSAGKYRAVVTEASPAENLTTGIDPYMARLGKEVSQTAKKNAPAPARKEFPVEVSATKTTFDFDLKK
ncbi:carboxypeptidase-like regulatory domain-containing protein [Isosphaeraceae bacterium EP7]